jgi:DNA-binding CsgD family transcriptional regulator
MRIQDEHPITFLNRNIAFLLDKVDEIENRLRALEDFCDNKHDKLTALHRNLTWSNEQLVMQVDDFEERVKDILSSNLPNYKPRKPHRERKQKESSVSLASLISTEFNDVLCKLPSDDIFHRFSITERCIFSLHLGGLTFVEIGTKIDLHKTSVYRYLRAMTKKTGCFDFDQLLELWQQKVKENINE